MLNRTFYHTAALAAFNPMPSDNREGWNLPNTALAKDLYDARFRNGTGV